MSGAGEQSGHPAPGNVSGFGSGSSDRGPPEVEPLGQFLKEG